jgi:translation initiation factor 4G
LTACQHEFETKTEDKIKEATKDLTAPDEIEYHANLIRKAYIGHMRFLGELYMRDVVKLTIISHCLDELLKDEEHEESLECFASLMTTMGAKLDPHARQNGKPFDWAKVEAVRNHTTISNRIKFLLQDLLELKNCGTCIVCSGDVT